MSAARDRLKSFGQGQIPPEKAPLAFRVGTVLAFDQTLTKTGMALVRCNTDQTLTVLQTRMIKPDVPKTLKGNEGTTQKALILHDLLVREKDEWLNEDVALEMPPAGGGLHRSESSLIAQIMVRLVWPEATLIHAKTARSKLLGDPKADKAAVKAWVLETFPTLDKSVGPLNYDTYDAIFIACAHLLEES